jgi:hypothetical protein
MLTSCKVLAKNTLFSFGLPTKRKKRIVRQTIRLDLATCEEIHVTLLKN